MIEVPHRYLKDKQSETYFPITHIDAVQGINPKDTEDTLTDMNNKISQMNQLITKANKSISNQQKIIDEQKKTIDRNKEIINYFDVAIGDMVGDTGWVDYGIQPHMRDGAIPSGFKCGIREVRVGNNLIPSYFVIRSIRLNISNITGSSMKIAELPIGFITDNQSFVARQHGYRHPITIECKKDGSVTAFVHPDDQSKTNWVYQQFTWLE